MATAGAYLRRSTYSFETYLRKYEQDWIIDQYWSAKLPEYERTLYTPWDISYDRLKKDDDRAARLLSLLAYFSNGRLWYELFKTGLSRKEPPKWVHEVACSSSAFESAMGKLTDYCFLEVQASMQSWSMHTCVHDWTFATLNELKNKQQYQYAFDCVEASVRKEDWGHLDSVKYSDLTAHALKLEHI